MFIAYFDESGDPSSTQAFTIGGLVSSETRWVNFEHKWKRILRRFKLPYFHAADFESGYGPFAKLTASEKIECSSNLISLIKRSIRFGFAHSLIVKDWKRLIVPTLSTPKEAQRGHYIFLLQSRMEEIVRYVTIPPNEKIVCIFDQNGFMAHTAIVHFQDLVRMQKWTHLFGGISFHDKKELVVLQAADLLAYEGFKDIINRVIGHSKIPERSSFKSLHSSGKIEFGWYEERTLQAFLRRLAAFKLSNGQTTLSNWRGKQS